MTDYTLGKDERAACTIARSVAKSLRDPAILGKIGVAQEASRTIATLLTIIDHLTLRLSQAGIKDH